MKLVALQCLNFCQDTNKNLTITYVRKSPVQQKRDGRVVAVNVEA